MPLSPEEQQRFLSGNEEQKLLDIMNYIHDIHFKLSFQISSQSGNNSSNFSLVRQDIGRLQRSINRIMLHLGIQEENQ